MDSDYFSFSLDPSPKVDDPQFAGPAFEVISIKRCSLSFEDVKSVAELFFASARHLCPSQLGQNRVLGCGHGYRQTSKGTLSSASEARLIEGLISQHPEVDFFSRFNIKQIEHSGAADGIENAFATDVEPWGWERCE